MSINKLAHLLKLTQEKLKIEVCNYLQQKKMKPIYEDGFVYAIMKILKKYRAYILFTKD